MGGAPTNQNGIPLVFTQPYAICLGGGGTGNSANSKTQQSPLERHSFVAPVPATKVLLLRLLLNLRLRLHHLLDLRIGIERPPHLQAQQKGQGKLAGSFFLCT